MTATITVFRTNLMSLLSTALNVPFQTGVFDGPSPNRDIGMVGPDEIAEDPAHVLEENLAVVVSVCQAFVKPADLEDPFDPSQLETWAEALQAVIQTHQTVEGPWFYRLNRVKFDLANQRIDCLVTGRQFNLGVYPQ